MDLLRTAQSVEDALGADISPQEEAIGAAALKPRPDAARMVVTRAIVRLADTLGRLHQRGLAGRAQ
jgi:hypothetical protein